MVFAKARQSGERCLNTTDINGAQPGTKNKAPFTWMERRDIRETNKVNDIFGCGPDTLMRGPNTKRCLNPLDPVYAVPGC